MTDTYEVKVVGKLEYAERKGGMVKANVYRDVSSEAIADLLLTIAGGGYNEGQVRKAMLYNSDLERDGELKVKTRDRRFVITKL